VSSHEDPAEYARTLVAELGLDAAYQFALEEAQRAKGDLTTFWVSVLLLVGKARRPTAAKRPVVVSYGGGLDSFCMLLEGVRRGERIDKVAFVDVTDPDQKDPGEWPGTYKHLREIVMPFCRKHGIPFVWIGSDCYPVRDSRSLYAWMKERGQIPIAGPGRICTIVGKVERFEKWMNDTYPGEDVDVWIGFEAGEEARAEKDPNAGRPSKKAGDSSATRHNRFPLIEWGLCRCRCAALVKKAGMPVPRKSACMMCPYGSKGDWQTLEREQPKIFKKIHQLEVDKPPTAKGKKLSIMGYRTLKDAEGRETGYRAPQLPEFVKGTYKAKKTPCKVCGAEQRETKATGSDFLFDPRKKNPLEENAFRDQRRDGKNEWSHAAMSEAFRLAEKRFKVRLAGPLFGCGNMGCAAPLEDGRVLKVTIDEHEVTWARLIYEHEIPGMVRVHVKPCVVFREDLYQGEEPEEDEPPPQDPLALYAYIRSSADDVPPGVLPEEGDPMEIEELSKGEAAFHALGYGLCDNYKEDNLGIDAHGNLVQRDGCAWELPRAKKKKPRGKK
jgi:hypothetical protein